MKESQPFTVKKINKRTPFFYYKLRGDSGWRSTKKKRRTDAILFVQNEVLGTKRTNKRITLKEFSEPYFLPGCHWVKRQEMMGRKLKQATLEGKRRLLTVHIRKNLGHFYLDELTPQVIEHFLLNLNLASSTKRSVLTIVTTLIKDARRDRLVDQPLQAEAYDKSREYGT